MKIYAIGFSLDDERLMRRTRSRSWSSSSESSSDDGDRSPTLEEQFQNLEEEGRNSVRLGTPQSRLIMTRQQSQRLSQDSLDRSVQQDLQLISGGTRGGHARNSVGRMLVAANATGTTDIHEGPPVEEAPAAVRNGVIGVEELGNVRARMRVVVVEEPILEEAQHTSPIALTIMVILIMLAIYNWFISSN